MDCPMCQVWMETSECPNCGYKNYALNVCEAHVTHGNIIVGDCERMYCVEKTKDSTFFCPHLEKMGHHKDARRITIFCNPIATEGIQ